MIIRSYFKCETCEHPHLVRIGMGQEEYQTHKFPCHGCGEPMTVALRVDYENLGAMPEAVENATLASDLEGATTQNVHANFVIPEGQQNIDGVFPHLPMMKDMLETALKENSLVDGAGLPASQLAARPFRRPDFSAEWKILKKAWNLRRNERHKLSQREVKKGSDLYYANDPLDGVEDWVWRHSMMLCGRTYGRLLDDAMNVVKRVRRLDEFTRFTAFYDSDMASDRATRYFARMKEFFSCYGEFSQVLFAVSGGGFDPAAHRTSSADFDAVRLFYGNEFEAFSSDVDILAYLNNMDAGRAFDQFASLTQTQYLALDKASRFNAFSMNPPLAALCSESDNQIRNASHHGGMQFDEKTQVITYQAGKGGTGAKQTLSYAEYLTRSTRLFLQHLTILRLELLIAQQTGTKLPI